jgi:hypothetical protein
MRVLIVSVNHQIQPAQVKGASTDGSVEAFERKQKESFVLMLQTEIRERGIRFIGEEARHGDVTIAQRLRGFENCHYANIEMTPQEREYRKIPASYTNDRSNLSEVEKTRCNREREEYMCAKALAEAGDADSILIICGRAHTEVVAAILRQLDHNVEQVDLRDQPWYVENWAEHCMRNL